MKQSEWNDHRIELIIGNLLRSGVIISATVVLFGGAIYLLRHGSATVDYHIFYGAPPSLRSLAGIVHGSLQLSGRALIQFGLLLLIATPIARVLFSAVAFALEKDRLYVAITLAVLAVLCYSLIGSQLH